MGDGPTVCPADALLCLLYLYVELGDQLLRVQASGLRILLSPLLDPPTRASVPLCQKAYLERRCPALRLLGGCPGPPELYVSDEAIHIVHGMDLRKASPAYMRILRQNALVSCNITTLQFGLVTRPQFQPAKSLKYVLLKSKIGFSEEILRLCVL